MRVLIVGRTHMGNQQACVGALALDVGRSLRLFDQEGEYPQRDHYGVGQIWEMDVAQKANVRPPHIEDVLVVNEMYVNQAGNLRQTILDLVEPWDGDIDHVFENTLKVANSKLYVAPDGPIPTRSTHFWIADRVMNRVAGQSRYETVTAPHRSVPYVGLDPIVPSIQVGDLVRLSLAGWYQGQLLREERCYLQISGSFG